MQQISLEAKRHSLSHILAQAVESLYPDAKKAIGPAVENGFYFDFDFGDFDFKEEHLKDVEKKMRHILKQNQRFERYEMSVDEAHEKALNTEKNPYKVEIIDDLVASEHVETVSYYQNILPSGAAVYEDLCRGPHVESTSELDADAFRLDRVAGAYWRGDESRTMLTRIYGIAFESRADLDAYEKMREEAAKRDHRVLGKKLGLFTIDPDVGLGLPLWKPKWAMIVNTLKRWFEDVQLERGYMPVLTPHIGRKSLWETSGHWQFYKDGMYPPIELGMSLEDYQDNRKPSEHETYLLKPMNCPGHVKVFTADPHSYRDLPVRLYEFGTVYRYEQKWELSGLTRVRGFTQDDAHIICRSDQMREEFAKVVDLVHFVLHETFGFEVKTYISLRDPKNTEKYLGSNEQWNQAEETIQEILSEKGYTFAADFGGAVFYGPKADFKVRDSIGREWQLSTVQFDFNLPERFDMSFVNAAWENERPYMVHRALFGSLERFMGVMIEHFAGHFPLWLSPVQARIVPVSANFIEYAREVEQTLRDAGLRAETDDSDDALGKKIRNGEQAHIPYLLVIGEREMSDRTVALRDVRAKGQADMSLDDAISKLGEEARERRLGSLLSAGARG